jgi:hypothetical protein
MTELPLESPAEDVAEQHAEVLPEAAEDAGPPQVSWDADPADKQAQDDEVPIDEDEWR